MTDHEHERLPGGGVRRVSQRDRKTRLGNTGPLFSADDFDLKPETPESEQSESAKESPPILDAADVDDDLGEALSSLFPPAKERFPPLPDELPSDLDGADRAEPMAHDLSPAKHKGIWRYNLVTAIFLLATVGLCGVFAIIWQNPYSAINPLAPPTPFVEVTWTPDAFALGSAPVAVPTLPSPSSDQPFVLAEAGVIYAPNANGQGCDWASIAGSVSGLGGEPLDNFGVQITDAEDAERLDVKVFSGSAATFGAGGFELPLGGAPLEGEYIVQLFSAAGAPLSDEYRVATRASCDENVAVLNFIQVDDI